MCTIGNLKVVGFTAIALAVVATPVSANTMQTLSLVNDLPSHEWAVDGLMIRPSGSPLWSPNLLTAPLDVGAKISFDRHCKKEPKFYDFKIVRDGAIWWIVPHIDMCAGQPLYLLEYSSDLLETEGD